jgi:hypothetical protein
MGDRGDNAWLQGQMLASARSDLSHCFLFDAAHARFRYICMRMTETGARDRLA